MNSNQLVFDLQGDISFDRNNFYVSSANKDTVKLLDSWSNWPTRCLAIIGPAGSGKSHLASYWAEEVNAIVISARDILLAEVPALSERGAIVVEDCDGIQLNSADQRAVNNIEQAMFHLLNITSQKLSHIVLTGRTFPIDWPFALKDLVSRITAFPIAELTTPDDELLMAVMLKQFEDKQIKVDPGLISFACSRIDRTFEAVKNFVELIDRVALTEKREITIPTANKVLKSLYARA